MRAVGEHGLERGADGAGADQARAARVHADDLVVIGPAGHALRDVAALQRFVKRGLDIVGGRPRWRR